jgi:hypothetical protein
VSIPYTGSLPANYNSVAAVEAHDANKEVLFTHSGGDISLTYAPWYTDVLGQFGPKDEGDNSKWSLRSKKTGIIYLMIGNFDAGDYDLRYIDGAAEFAGTGLWNTRGSADEIVDDAGVSIVGIPPNPDEATAADAKSHAHDVIPFYWPGGDMFWKLKYTPNEFDILGMPPYPTWKLCAAPP